MELLEKVKFAMRITTDKLDNILISDIEAAKLDLGIAGVVIPDELDELVDRAIVTYCQLQEGKAEDYNRLKKAYDEQKAQLSMASEYTNYEK